MAAPICTVSSLITTYPQFSGKTLNDHQRLALSVWYKANQLASIGGTNYTANLLGTGVGSLLTAETAVLNTADDDQLKTAQLAIDYKNALAVGASVSATPATFMQSIKCLVNADPTLLAKFSILLDCQLGVSKAYPQ